MELRGTCIFSIYGEKSDLHAATRVAANECSLVNNRLHLIDHRNWWSPIDLPFRRFPYADFPMMDNETQTTTNTGRRKQYRCVKKQRFQWAITHKQLAPYWEQNCWTYFSCRLLFLHLYGTQIESRSNVSKIPHETQRVLWHSICYLIHLNAVYPEFWSRCHWIIYNARMPFHGEYVLQNKFHDGITSANSFQRRWVTSTFGF